MRRFPVVLLSGALLMGAALAACGDDSGSSSATTASGGSSSAGGLTVKATEYNFDVSGTAAGGFNKITFENDGKEPHILVALKLQPGKTVADALPLLEQEGEPDPAAAAAVFDGDPNTAFYGTPGLLAPGGRATTIADLPAGNYAFVCFLPSPDGQPHFSLGMAKDFTVADSGGSATPPQTDGTITITADKITAPDGMKSGTYEVKNTGSDTSDFNMAGPTDKQVSDFDEAVNGYFASIGTDAPQAFSIPAPLVGGFSDSLPPGKSGYVVLDLEKGRYIMAGNSDEDTGKTLVSGEFEVS